jgi:hypothetical protein
MAKTSKNSKNTKSINNKTRKCCQATMKGLHQWFVNVFEERGWMILAKSRGMNDKVNVYKSSLQRLKQSLDNALAEYKDADRKRDVKIMCDNVAILIEDVEKNL